MILKAYGPKLRGGNLYPAGPMPSEVETTDSALTHRNNEDAVHFWLALVN
jgi:hypothetical protein